MWLITQENMAARLYRDGKVILPVGPPLVKAIRWIVFTIMVPRLKQRHGEAHFQGRNVHQNVCFVAFDSSCLTSETAAVKVHLLACSEAFDCITRPSSAHEVTQLSWNFPGPREHSQSTEPVDSSLSTLSAVVDKTISNHGPLACTCAPLFAL